MACLLGGRLPAPPANESRTGHTVEAVSSLTSSGSGSSGSGSSGSGSSGSGSPTGAGSSPSARVDLRVLVVTNGDSNVEAIRAQLATEGVPTTVVNLSEASRPMITPGFLSDTVATGPRARYQAVVLPNDSGGGLSIDEMAALTAYEVRFGIRQVDSYNFPGAGVGLSFPLSSGSLDGRTATVTAAGLQSPFPYLNGTFSVDDYLPDVSETYGYLATPLSGFTPLVTVGGSPIVGTYTDSERERLVITAAFNGSQTWFRLIAHGLVTWMTKGVHLGYDRNYFAVHVDDVLVTDERWSTTHNCTAGMDCPAALETKPDIRMTPADVQYLVDWQSSHGFSVDLAFNAAGSVNTIASAGGDPLTTALLASRNSLSWLNHTYSHQFLGCVQDFSTVPWRCRTDSAGKTLYMSATDISAEIAKNITWARANGVPLTTSDLVTGEHSGLAVMPQQPGDNPNLAAALSANGITSIGSDASREPGQRSVGPAGTVPRHPMNIFFNVATEAEEVDEYNWLYTSSADGGSGLCQRAGSTCIEPLATASAYAGYIVPLEARIALGHVLANDPRPHFMHQSNLAEDRIGYDVLDSVLASYRGLFAANAGLLSLPMGQQGMVLRRAAAWKTSSDAGTISAYTLGGSLFVTSSVKGQTLVPVTVPQNVSFGLPYAGERSDYVGVNARSALVLALAVPGSERLRR